MFLFINFEQYNSTEYEDGRGDNFLYGVVVG